MAFSDHCLYIYFICTDHIGNWPDNKKSCVNYFVTCLDAISQGSKHEEKGREGPVGTSVIT